MYMVQLCVCACLCVSTCYKRICAGLCRGWIENRNESFKWQRYILATAAILSVFSSNWPGFVFLPGVIVGVIMFVSLKYLQ